MKPINITKILRKKKRNPTEHEDRIFLSQRSPHISRMEKTKLSPLGRENFKEKPLSIIIFLAVIILLESMKMTLCIRIIVNLRVYFQVPLVSN